MDSGIYKISLNGKEYIGSAKNIKDRIRRHLGELRHNKHGNKRLQHAYNKYGENGFCYTTLELVETGDLIQREQYYLDALHPYYNICKTAGSSLGRLHSAETRAHFSKVRKGNQTSLGRVLREETKEKIRVKAKARGLHPNFALASKLANTGSKHSPEIRLKVSEKQKKLTRHDVANIMVCLDSGARQIDLAKLYGVSQTVISRAKTGKGIYGTFELDADYYRMAKQRLDDFIRQPRIDSLMVDSREQIGLEEVT